MEFKTLAAVLLMIIVIIMVIMLVSAPSTSAQEGQDTEISFRQACLYWSLKQYRGTTYTHPDNGELSMLGPCNSALGFNLDEATAGADPNFWTNCANACQLKTIETGEEVNDANE